MLRKPSNSRRGCKIATLLSLAVKELYLGVDGWGGEARQFAEMEEAGGRGCTEEVAPATAAASEARHQGSSAAGSGVCMGAVAGAGDRREHDEAPHAGDVGEQKGGVRKPASKA